MTGRVHVIGVPPGAEGLPADVRAAVAGCSLVAGARRHLALVSGFAGELVALEGRTAEVVDRVAAAPDLAAALLASGDPGFFGLAALVLRRIPRERVRVWPAVSSMQLAFARAGEPWSHARFASLHGRPLENLAPVLGAERIGLFTDPRNDPAAIARFCVDAGWDDYEMVVAEDLGTASERISRAPVTAVREWSGSDLNVVLLVRPGPDPRPAGPGLPDHGFSHDRGLITKREVRAVAQGLLSLPRRGVLWDVGAGSGSVAVEACLGRPGLRAYAVERTDAGLAHIRENRRRFRVAGLVPVAGEAPAVLTGLPDPDAVYVGGTGGRVHPVLDACWTRLRPGGSLVVAAVLVDTLADAMAWARGRGLTPELTEIAAARSRPVAGRTRMEPLNPVTLVRFGRPEGGEA